MLSKCPNCKSTFEIDEVQLAAAKGLVRCGSCLHVFNGREHLIGSPEETKSVKEFSGIDQELEAIEAQIQALTAQRRPKSSRSIDADIADFAKLFQDDATTPLKSIDDQITSFDITKGKPEPFPSNENFNDSWSEEETAAEAGIINKSIELEKEEDQILKQSPSKTSSATQPSSSKTAAPKKRSKLEDDINEFFADSDTISHTGSGTTSLRPASASGFEKSKKNSKSLDQLQIDDEPLSLSHQDETETKPWIGKAISMLLLAMLVGFIGYVAIQFDELSLDPKWRPKLAVVCQFAPCTLAPTHSVKYLKVTSLTTTAKDKNIEINAVIYNTNPNFDMPYPNLVMKFTDLNDNLVAEFDIHPDEYRHGELARLAEFPSNTSAHITFEIPSPGKEGVNYSLSFAYPDP